MKELSLRFILIGILTFCLGIQAIIGKNNDFNNLGVQTIKLNNLNSIPNNYKYSTSINYTDLYNEDEIRFTHEFVVDKEMILKVTTDHGGFDISPFILANPGVRADVLELFSENDNITQRIRIGTENENGINQTIFNLKPGTYQLSLLSPDLKELVQGYPFELEIFITFAFYESETPLIYISSDQNYIHTRTYIKESGEDYLDAIQYFDGLGRPMQTVQRGITPNKQDLVSFQEYDAFGRESNMWLPMTSTTNGAFVNPSIIKDKILSSPLYSGDKRPFSEPIYEASPLSRVFGQYGPGEDWHNNSKAVKVNYLANVSGNTSLNCKFYVVFGTASNPSLKERDNYSSGELYVNRVEDENGNASYEFKNKLGQVVLTRQINNGTNYDTYYVYDDFGNLTFVLPPRIQDEGIEQGKLDTLAYQYRYDYRNRCVWKKLPGCEPIFYAYDRSDHLIFIQDGEQRKRNKDEWTIFIYDVFNRVAINGTINKVGFYINDDIESGLMESGITSSSIVECVERGELSFHAEYTGSTSNLGYEIKLSDNCPALQNSPTGNYVFQIESVIQTITTNYYDNYDFLGKNGFPNQPYEKEKELDGYGKRYDEGKGYEAKGQLTGTLTAILGKTNGGPEFIYTTMYYDNRGNIIQSSSTDHLGKKSSKRMAYSFTGQLLKMVSAKSMKGADRVREEIWYTYDHAGRLLKTRYQLGTDMPFTLSTNEYDELGRLRTRKYIENAKLQSDYTYNIRSWTKSITSPLFKQELFYNESDGANTPSYNGNISRVRWKDKDNQSKSYNFGYDALSQLKSADYSGQGDYGANYTYDKHGNMLTLERKGKKAAGTAATDYGTIDKLTMSYNGNQLVNVIDGAPDVLIAESSDFKDYSDGKGVYEYNANGAMTKDTHKGISNIEYNSLNLPMSIAIDNGKGIKGSVQYLYSATGVKLQAIHKEDITGQTDAIAGTVPFDTELGKPKTTDYVENLIYEDGELIKVLFDGGYYDAKTKKYCFFIKDHLGNNRVVVDNEGTVIQRSDYYPFGMEFADNTHQEEQPYKYNGKELDKTSGLNLYDYSARYMEPAIGRFTSVDPLAEKYYSWSPYAYVMNNTLKYTDPDGRNPITQVAKLRKGIRAYRTIKTARSISNSKVDITFWEILNTNQMVEGDRSEEVCEALFRVYRENQKNQEKKDREAKEKHDADQARITQAIDDNITGTSPSGDPSPKRPPKGKVGKIVVGGGLLAELLRSIFYPEPPVPQSTEPPMPKFELPKPLPEPEFPKPEPPKPEPPKPEPPKSDL